MGAIVIRNSGGSTAKQPSITNVLSNFASCSFLALGVWFLVRRFVGAFSRPLTLAEVSVCGGLLIVASALISLWSVRPAGSSHRGPASRWPRIVTLLSVGCFGGALSLTGTSYASLGCFWMLLLVAISVPAVGLVRRQSNVSARKSAVDRLKGTIHGHPVRFAPSGNAVKDFLHFTLTRFVAGVASLLAFSILDDPNSRESGYENRSPSRPQWPTAAVAETARLAKDNASGEITQQMTRETMAADQERVRGVLRVSFGPGQQLAVVHAGFCPPLSRLPRIEVTQMDGPPATVNPSQVLPYGVGFDVRLRESPPAAETVRIAFTAMA